MFTQHLLVDQIEVALSYLPSQNGAVTPEEILEHAEPRGMSVAEKQARDNAIEGRKMVRTYAKRALRDYLAFIAHFDYTPGLASDVTEAFLKQVNSVANGYKTAHKGRGTAGFARIQTEESIDRFGPPQRHV